jgi:hypothetical protein
MTVDSSAELSGSASKLATPTVDILLEEFDNDIASENPGRITL